MTLPALRELIIETNNRYHREVDDLTRILRRFGANLRCLFIDLRGGSARSLPPTFWNLLPHLEVLLLWSDNMIPRLDHTPNSLILPPTLATISFGWGSDWITSAKRAFIIWLSDPASKTEGRAHVTTIRLPFPWEELDKRYIDSQGASFAYRAGLLFFSICFLAVPGHHLQDRDGVESDIGSRIGNVTRARALRNCKSLVLLVCLTVILNPLCSSSKLARFLQK